MPEFFTSRPRKRLTASSLSATKYLLVPLVTPRLGSLFGHLFVEVDHPTGAFVDDGAHGRIKSVLDLALRAVRIRVTAAVDAILHRDFWVAVAEQLPVKIKRCLSLSTPAE